MPWRCDAERATAGTDTFVFGDNWGTDGLWDFADGSEIKGIKDMALPQLRRDDTPSAEAVTGARAKINDNYFLVGLTKSDADTARNLDLIATHNWFDFPLLLNDDRIAKLTFEKSTEGDYVVSQALAAWK